MGETVQGFGCVVGDLYLEIEGLTERYAQFLVYAMLNVTRFIEITSSTGTSLVARQATCERQFPLCSCAASDFA